ncbi:MAG TPA: aminotransferase class IV [Candidatus Saccharimonadales bacterium]|nr:aminotransferase class IV [Candidatus Saccharimonadales bacterium]
MIWLDGRLVPADVPHLSVTDRGFQLGDGIFETLRVRRDVAIEFDEHTARLRASAGVLELPAPRDDSVIARAIHELLVAEGLAGREGSEPGDAAIRITLSRGPTEARGLLPPGTGAPSGTLAIQAWPFALPSEALLARGVHAVASTVRRDPSSPMAGVKSTSRADSVYAKLEAQRLGADDAVFLTPEGHLSETTTANLFLVRGRGLATPPLHAAILAGTTRTWLLAEASGLGFSAVQADLRSVDLATADEAFVSSSVAGIVPLTAWEGRPVGTGRPGPVTRRLREARETWIDDQSRTRRPLQAWA